MSTAFFPISPPSLSHFPDLVSLSHDTTHTHSAVEDQAVDRVHRIGQIRPVHVNTTTTVC